MFLGLLAVAARGLIGLAGRGLLVSAGRAILYAGRTVLGYVGRAIGYAGRKVFGYAGRAFSATGRAFRATGRAIRYGARKAFGYAGKVLKEFKQPVIEGLVGVGMNSLNHGLESSFGLGDAPGIGCDCNQCNYLGYDIQQSPCCSSAFCAPPPTTTPRTPKCFCHLCYHWGYTYRNAHCCEYCRSLRPTTTSQSSPECNCVSCLDYTYRRLYAVCCSWCIKQPSSNMCPPALNCVNHMGCVEKCIAQFASSFMYSANHIDFKRSRSYCLTACSFENIHKTYSDLFNGPPLLLPARRALIHAITMRYSSEKTYMQVIDSLQLLSCALMAILIISQVLCQKNQRPRLFSNLWAAWLYFAFIVLMGYIIGMLVLSTRNNIEFMNKLLLHTISIAIALRSIIKKPGTRNMQVKEPEVDQQNQ